MDDRELPRSDGRRVVSTQLVGGGLIAAAVLAFVFQNTEDAQVDWLVFDATLPLWVLLVVTGVLSVLAFELVGSAVRRHRRKQD